MVKQHILGFSIFGLYPQAIYVKMILILKFDSFKTVQSTTVPNQILKKKLRVAYIFIFA